MALINTESPLLIRFHLRVCILIICKKHLVGDTFSGPGRSLRSLRPGFIPLSNCISFVLARWYRTRALTIGDRRSAFIDDGDAAQFISLSIALYSGMQRAEDLLQVLQVAVLYSQ